MSYRTEIDRLLATMPSDWKAQWAGARSQLRALDYDAAALPDVDDAMQALYLTAGGNESGDPIKGPIPVPAAVRDEAMRALRMAHKHNYGAWNFIGIARAIQLAVVPSIGVKSVDRMRAFFTRHQKDATAPHFGDNQKPSRGYLAHLVWGGDAAKQWVNDMKRQVRRNAAKRKNPLSDAELAHVQDVVASGKLKDKNFTLAAIQQRVADADELMPLFKKMLEKAKNGISGAQNSYIKMDRKKAPSISRKMASESRYRSLLDLKDILRGALLIEEGHSQAETDRRVEEFYKLLKSARFWAGSPFTVDSIKDLRDAQQIYKGPIHLIFSGMPSSGIPLLIELQVMPRCLWTIKSLSHIEYEKVRVAGGSDREALRSADNLMARLFRSGQYCAVGKAQGRKAKHLKRSQQPLHNPSPTMLRYGMVSDEDKDKPFSSGFSEAVPPSRRGEFEGQAITAQKKVDTGKFAFIPMPPEVAARMRREGKEPGDKMRVAIKETQTVTYWVWDGRKWVKPDEWRSSTIAPYEQTEYERRLSTRHKREAPPPSPVAAPRQPALKKPKRDKDLEKIARMFRSEN